VDDVDENFEAGDACGGLGLSVLLLGGVAGRDIKADALFSLLSDRVTVVSTKECSKGPIPSKESWEILSQS
jgi:hypothetical protein